MKFDIQVKLSGSIRPTLIASIVAILLSGSVAVINDILPWPNAIISEKAQGK